MDDLYCKMFINSSMSIEELAKKISEFLELKMIAFY